ncbi:S1C family serine protease [Hyphomicrobiales bacterium]|nr:S1C family serine protease [Hyphomicrobiales bacterium]
MKIFILLLVQFFVFVSYGNTSVNECSPNSHQDGCYGFKEIDDALYTGQFKNNNPHGYGTWRNKDDTGYFFFGEFDDGWANGRGVKISQKDGKIQFGDWKHNKLYYGIEVNLDKDIYIGEFGPDQYDNNWQVPHGVGYLNKLNGKNKIDGNVYFGDFSFSEVEGYGVSFRDANHIEQRNSRKNDMRKSGIFEDGKFIRSESLEPASCKRSLRPNKEGIYCFGVNADWNIGTFHMNKLNGFGALLFRQGYEVGEYLDGKVSGYAFNQYEIFPDDNLSDISLTYSENPDNEINIQGHYLTQKDGSIALKWDIYVYDNEKNKYWFYNDAAGISELMIGFFDENPSNVNWRHLIVNDPLDEIHFDYIGYMKENVYHGNGIQTTLDKSGNIIEMQSGEWFEYELVNEFDHLNPDSPMNNQYTKKDDNITQFNPNELIAVASGSGFIINDAGYIVTNNHVIDGCSEIKISYDNLEYPIKLIANDPINDLSILKSDINVEEYFNFSNVNSAILNDIIVAGYPFGKSVSSSVKVTKGIVSSQAGVGNNYSIMQIDAPIQPGNSGGPIFNTYGNIVGVAVAKLDSKVIMDAYGVIPENTNFGIKVSVLKNILDSNNIKYHLNTQNDVNGDIVNLVNKATLYISCHMTYAQLEDYKSINQDRVFFSIVNK